MVNGWGHVAGLVGGGHVAKNGWWACGQKMGGGHVAMGGRFWVLGMWQWVVGMWVVGGHGYGRCACGNMGGGHVAKGGGHVAKGGGHVQMCNMGGGHVQYGWWEGTGGVSKGSGCGRAWVWGCHRLGWARHGTEICTSAGRALARTRVAPGASTTQSLFLFGGEWGEYYSKYCATPPRVKQKKRCPKYPKCTKVKHGCTALGERKKKVPQVLPQSRAQNITLISRNPPPYQGASSSPPALVYTDNCAVCLKKKTPPPGALCGLKVREKYYSKDSADKGARA